MENGINIDPINLTIEKFAVAGDMDGRIACTPIQEFKHPRSRTNCCQWFWQNVRLATDRI